MKQTYPSKDVLSAFNIKTEPELIKEGDRNIYKAENIVLKSVNNAEEVSGIADLFSKIDSKDFYVEKPVKSKFGKWVYEGWSAFIFADGRTSKSRWVEKIEISDKFHKAISDVNKPAYIHKVINPWSIADRMVWGETKLVSNQQLTNIILPLYKNVKPLNLNNQLIHGDLSGNILFNDPFPPSIIDMSPAWRPKDYAKAIIIADAIVWENAPDSLLNQMKNNYENNQLLLRATLWRIKATEEYVKFYNKGSIYDIYSYKHLINLLLKRLKVDNNS